MDKIVEILVDKKNHSEDFDHTIDWFKENIKKKNNLYISLCKPYFTNDLKKLGINNGEDIMLKNFFKKEFSGENAIANLQKICYPEADNQKTPNKLNESKSKINDTKDRFNSNEFETDNEDENHIYKEQVFNQLFQFIEAIEDKMKKNHNLFRKLKGDRTKIEESFEKEANKFTLKQIECGGYDKMSEELEKKKNDYEMKQKRIIEMAKKQAQALVEAKKKEV